jgi:two-component system sensor histidine kinase GlrK
VLIDFLDEGPGIAPDELERVFEPFYQGRHNLTGPGQGNGIGLAIVREFIAAHRGKVRALPNAYGAHFRIELPHA